MLGGANAGRTRRLHTQRRLGHYSLDSHSVSDQAHRLSLRSEPPLPGLPAPGVASTLTSSPVARRWRGAASPTSTSPVLTPALLEKNHLPNSSKAC